MTQRITDSMRRQIEAYHDGELSRFGRWRFERAMRRNPELRVELNHLRNQREELQGLLRTDAFDVWEDVRVQLPAPGTRPEGAPASVSPTPASDWGLGGFAWPGAAVAATAVLAAVFAIDWQEPQAPPAGIVSWIDTGGHDVMLLQGAPDTTIIWVVGGPTPGSGRSGGEG